MDGRKVLLVARWEFLTAVTRRTYIFAVVLMPVVYGLMLAAAGLADRMVARNETARPVAVVDEAHVIDFAAARAAAAEARAHEGAVSVPSASPMRPQPAPDLSPRNAPILTEFGDKDRALAALRTQTVAAVYVLDADYLATGHITSYSSDRGLLATASQRRRRTEVGDAIRASLLAGAMAGDTRARALAPVGNVTRMRMDAKGEVVPDDASDNPFTGAFGVFFMLTMAIFFSAGFLQQATIEDRQNRTIEILLSSLDTDEMLIGKMLGLSGAGLLQVAIYLTLLVVPGVIVLAIVQISAAKLALSLVYFIIGYTLFASLMAGTGMLGRTAQESAQMSAIWTLTSASPMFFLAPISAAPNGLLARALSFFPLTGPVTMMIRLGGSDVPAIDVIVSVAIECVSIYFILRAASKILRAASLMYGKRATLPELVRWLRAT
jgi:ABC-2 type transport system permease protein